MKLLDKYLEHGGRGSQLANSPLGRASSLRNLLRAPRACLSCYHVDNGEMGPFSPWGLFQGTLSSPLSAQPASIRMGSTLAF